MLKRIIAVLAALCMIYGSQFVKGEEDGRTGESIERSKAIVGESEGAERKIAKDGIQSDTCDNSTSDDNNPHRNADEDFGVITPVPVGGEYGTTDNQSEYDATGEGFGVIAQVCVLADTEDRTDSEGYGEVTEEDSGVESGGGVEDATFAEEDTTIPEEDATIEQVVEQVEEPQLIYLGDWTITAYCGCEICCGSYGNATASGAFPTAFHTVACNILPFGTELLIDGNIYVVEDTGYTPYGDEWIDIYFDTHEEAEAWGLQVKEVYLIG